MNKEEISAIANEVVEIYFNENVSVKEAIALCIGKEGEIHGFEVDKRAI